MAALLEKMDQQNEQLQLLTRQQAERVDGIVLKQKETDENLDAIKGDLDSVKGIMDGQMSAMEESIAGLKVSIQRLVSSKESLKQELREELLRELATPTSLGVTRLWPMAPPFVPSDATVGDIPREGTGGVMLRALETLLEVKRTAPTTTATRPAFRGKEKPFR